MPEEIVADSKSDIYVNPENTDSLTQPEAKPAADAQAEAKTEDKTPVAADPASNTEEGKAKVVEEEKPEPKAKKPGVQGRIDELTRARREAERRAELAEKKLKEFEKAEKIDPDKFNDASEHAAAVAREEGRKSAYAAHKEEAAADIEAVDAEIEQVLIEDWTDAVEEAKKELPDFDKVLSESKSPLPPHLQRAILECPKETKAEIAYHLAKNTAEAVHMARLSPLALGRELAKLEIRLQSVKAPEKKVVSNAPAPIEPIKAKTSGAGGDDFADWKSKRDKEAKIRR